MNWKKPGPNCINRVQNATESLLTAINGSLTVHVRCPNTIQHVQTLHLRCRRGSNGRKNIMFEPHLPRSSYACLRSVPFDFGLQYVSHLCHISSHLYWPKQYKREDFPLLAVRITLHTVWITFLQVPLKRGETGRETSQCDLGINHVSNNLL